MPNSIPCYSYFKDRPALPDSLYFDTNCLVSLYIKSDNKHNKIKYIFARALRDKRQAYISTLGFDELWWALLCISYKEACAGYIQLTAKLIKQDPSIISGHIDKLKEATTALKEIPGLKVLPVKLGIEDTALFIMESCLLSPRDALHAAVAATNGVKCIVSNDEDFGRLKDVPLEMILRY